MKTKHRWAIFLAAVCIASVALIWWMLNSQEDHDRGSAGQSPLPAKQEIKAEPSESVGRSEDSEKDRDSPRSAETQTRQTPKTEVAAQPHNTTPYLASDISELKYKTLDATLDEYARLMLIEYDRLMSEGVKEINARLQAFLNIQDRIVDNVHPELTTAMIFFQDQRTIVNFNPVSMLVRVGRLPPTAQINVFELPNGEIYTIEEPHTEVVIRYQRKKRLSEYGRLTLENLRSRELDILERMATGDLSLETEWQDVRAEIERIETRVTNRTLAIRWGDKEHPDFKIIDLDLGIIED